MKELFTFCGEQITGATLKERPWLKLLYVTERSRYSIERAVSVSEVHPDEVLRYVERTLDCVREDLNSLNDTERLLVETTLQWSEVAKCGNDKKRESWRKRGYNLAVHNEGSASIFLRGCRDIMDAELRESVAVLIRTHGLLGQYLRGETRLSESSAVLNMPVVVSGLIEKDRLEQMLYVLNKGIVQGVSRKLWDKVGEQIRNAIHVLCVEENLAEFSVLERLQRMLPGAFGDVTLLTETEQAIYEPLLKTCDLWYPQAALDTFSREELEILCGQITAQLQPDIRHISFYELSTTLYYDYEGRKKENVYKRRIIESFLKQAAEQENTGVHHAFLKCFTTGDTLCVDMGFTPACEKLVDFCVEAERSGIVDYQKNITAIFDIFGFRRDIFDRLNNEEQYLATMNDTQESRKTEILDMVTGSIIVDVGSGGGVLLDEIEKRFPDKTIIGTDISTNVIETLHQKIRQEGHGYQVLKHNFVEGPLPFQADTIIFSSILHEIYSYSEYQGEKFRMESVLLALKHATASLKKGGRILIRDGIYTDAEKVVTIRMKTADGLNFLKNYDRDFRGLPLLVSSGRRKPVISGETLEVQGDINFIREFLYTYTWGEESYSCEINEQFGYLTLAQYRETLEQMGLVILHGEEYCEPGYEEHLSPLVELTDFAWKDIPSNCILAGEKR